MNPQDYDFATAVIDNEDVSEVAGQAARDLYEAAGVPGEYARGERLVGRPLLLELGGDSPRGVAVIVTVDCAAGAFLPAVMAAIGLRIVDERGKVVEIGDG